MIDDGEAMFVCLPDVRWVMHRDGRPTGLLRLLSDLVYISAGHREYRVPAGFTTDLASVPTWLPLFLRYLFRDQLRTAWAAILHDWLYTEQKLPRATCDALFYEALIASGETGVGAWAMWLGVRAGGWRSWRQVRRARRV